MDRTEAWTEDELAQALRRLVESESMFDTRLLVRGGVVEARRDDALVLVVGASEPAMRLEQLLAPFASEMSETPDRPVGLATSCEPLLREARRFRGTLVSAALASRPSDEMLSTAIEGLFGHIALRQADRTKAQALLRYRYEIRELVEIAKALSQERDIDKLLGLILEKSRFICGADAGSIYVIDEIEGTDRRSLRFKLSQNDSCEFESTEFTMPVSTRSIAGYAVVTGEPLSIPNVYDLPAGAPYGFEGSFDRRVGYRTRSMIAVPMISAENQVIGVIQLINKKVEAAKKLDLDRDLEGQVVPFDERSTELLHTLASQAGIALENALLYDEIRTIFEGFVHASVQAIEQRDPTTSGHSQRVSLLSCRLAETVDRAGDGLYRAIRFSARDLKELEYASLLHDFGKIGVREKVLVKAKKLYPENLLSIHDRVAYALKAAEASSLKTRLELIEKGAGAAELARAQEPFDATMQRLHEAWRLIQEANEPTISLEGDFSRIEELARITFVDIMGETRALLDSDEVRCLQVRRGTLHTAELDEIRSHVMHTRRFLDRIPWGQSYQRIPEIAGAHHERLDGSGYPRGIQSEEIPLPSKIMSIADVYDALTAADRPYKKAVPSPRALDILGYEVKDGHLDGELVRLFREAEVYRIVEAQGH